ncbi:glycosyltransferase family 4 protein [Nesterenkonia sandarakina]|uniref:Glycosyltransferase involved in cell wall biosynthesis n=1 Tax=Nesterenkonia sandarakina TaxID=272918 RepID=A0A7Z0EAM7_9MICC|nr:glycosyltransferase family 4 protein [Nesterenkonia sandarakina]NYJ17402.1 glycosyltransferase involved in cell wall biosynthesis [Nesterenkonia sandarakina]
MARPRVYFVVQPTVAHYREPLLRRLLDSTRYDFDLVGRFKNSEATAADTIHSAAEEVLAKVRPLRFSAIREFWWEHGQVREIWAGEHDAYVIAGRIPTLSAWVACAVAALRGRTLIMWGHGWKRPEAGLKRQVRLAFYRLTDGLLVYGDRARELGSSYGVPAEKIQVIYNSIYPEALTCLARESAIPENGETPDDDAGSAGTIIYSSRLTTRHRLDLLAEALGEMPDAARPKVLIVGEGAERPRLEQVFADHGVDAQFLGAVYDYEQLRGLYARADLAVSVGGAGLNVTQAMSFGVPVLAEDGDPDSSPEIEAVIEGVTGRYYQTGDAGSLRRVLTELLAAPAQLRQLGEASLGVVRERYTAEKHAAAIEDALAVLLSRASRR